ncbi:hypothetical protein J2T55_001484 [Methylohalomonas lacus]|uniref:DUF4126 domain-containing protein n=1 Tax=Methylohalomonas lacus TaxID=398773 RepID=A0AAE3HMZ6_9GAMM|nr:DUF4126 domain-containing protein [Methylohalomonas lacus]MCS3903463.1 hypothetical protein [Methylohalomonas lacus]
MEVVQIIALSMGVAWASGINLYATVFMLGMLGSSGHIVLPPGLEVVTDPLVMFAAGLMYCVEFFADKTPGVDSGWDTIHTFIRIPAGAVLAMGAVGETSQAAELMAFLLGGGLAAGVHATKAGSRVLINTSPEPFSNWATSLGEDAVVIGGLWAALFHPVIFLVALLVFIIVMIWLLPKIWRGLATVFAKLRNLFRRPQPALPPAGNGDAEQADKSPR